MENKAINMHNILMKELERLDDETIKGKELETEFKRADAISKVAAQIISHDRLILDVIEVAHKFKINAKDLPDMLNAKPEPAQIPFLTKNGEKD